MNEAGLTVVVGTIGLVTTGVVGTTVVPEVPEPGSRGLEAADDINK